VNVLFVTSEVAPLAKTGGLADVSAALPAYLHGAGHDIRTFLPFYGSLKTDGLALTVALRDLEIRLGGHRYTVSIVVGERDPVRRLYVAPLENVRSDWPVVEIADAGHLNCIARPEFRDEIVRRLKD